MLLTGFVKVDFKRFFWTTFLFNLVSAILFVALGFYSGVAISSVARFFKFGGFIVPLLILTVIGIYFLARKISRIIAEKEKV